MLAEGDIANAVPALHFARQMLQMTKKAVIYTNGNEQIAEDVNKVLAEHPCAMSVDTRKITKLVKAPNRAEVTLHFENGTETTEGFLAHKPKSKLRGDLAEQLGLEMTPKAIIQVNPPFNQTSVKGVFAAGDCCNMMPTVTAALYSGTAAGGGAPLQLQAERLGQKGMF